MKQKWMAALAIMMMLALCLGAFAEEIDLSGMSLEDLRALRKSVDERIAVLEADEAEAAGDAEDATEDVEEDAPEAETETEDETEAEKPVYYMLKRGDKGDAVLAMQERLIQLGYLDADADGRYGAKTVTAVKAFQKAVGLKATGEAGEVTQERLFAEDAPAVGAEPIEQDAEPAEDQGETAEEKDEAGEAPKYKTLKKASKGDAVLALQERMIQLGYLDDDADGKYGAKTIEAVKAFQKANGLKANGIADPETQEAIFAEDAQAYKNYGEMKYDKLSGDPESYEGGYFKFSGRVLQVMEDDTYAETRGIYTVLRVASRKKYDDVVYVAYFRAKDSQSVEEEAQVTVYGKFSGMYTYTSASGKEVTIPKIDADKVETSGK